MCQQLGATELKEIQPHSSIPIENKKKQEIKKFLFFSSSDDRREMLAGLNETISHLPLFSSQSFGKKTAQS